LEQHGSFPLSYTGTEEHREQLCLADHDNVRQSPVIGEDQVGGLFELKKANTWNILSGMSVCLRNP
jgi:hypothetical protein